MRVIVDQKFYFFALPAVLLKLLSYQYDLALAYSPGVAAACEEIVRDPLEARNLAALTVADAAASRRKRQGTCSRVN